MVESGRTHDGSVHSLSGDTVIGGPEDDIQVDDGGAIAIVSWRDGAWRVRPDKRIVQLNGRAIETEQVLHHGDCISEERIRLRFLLGDRRRVLEEDRHLASVVDPLTQVLNRSFLIRHLARLAAPTAVMMIDIDMMKKLNDTYGFLGGDAALQVTARRLRDQLRWPEYIVRFGGEEFLVVLPGAAHADALVRAERMRVACEPPFAFEDVMLTATVSIGVTGLLPSPLETIREVDEAMIRAKEQGRNRVVG